MAWRIAPQIVRGEIDNRHKGFVTGKIWLRGCAEPLSLQLSGHPEEDLAGRRLEFVNPDPDDSTELVGFDIIQRGLLGDFTAARMVKVPTIPLDEMLKSKGKFPFYWSQCLYLEWFSESNGRVVIESTGFKISTSDPSWRLSSADVAAQQELNAKAWNAFLQSLDNHLRQGSNERWPVEISHRMEAPLVDDDEAIDRLLRINELKHETEKLCGGEMIHGSNGALPLAVEEEFWQNVLDFEKAPQRPRKEMLLGLPMPSADTLTDEQLTDALWALIRGMAKCSIYIHSTDHLSDRELYMLLVNTALEEMAPVLSSGWRSHICIDEYDSPTESAQTIYLRYYATEEMRQCWANDFPDDPMPPHEDPPYDRDRHLPQAE